MKEHKSSEPDYVLAEWIMALALNRKILPILVGKVAGDVMSKCDELNVNELKNSVSPEYPKKTIAFVKNELSRVLQRPVDDLMSGEDEWTVVKIVERLFMNLYLQWSAEDCIGKCRERVEEILKNPPANEYHGAPKPVLSDPPVVRRRPEPTDSDSPCCCAS